MPIYRYTTELRHNGVKGQRWGVRRYQNKDGSLTEAGQKRYARDQRENAGKKKGDKVGVADPDRWVREDLDRSKRVANESANASKNAKQLLDDVDNLRSKPKMDLSKMSDKELRDQINREYLERQYDDLFNPKKVSKGKENAKKVLAATGTTLTLASSALGIALAIKELKG